MALAIEEDADAPVAEARVLRTQRTGASFSALVDR